MEASTVVRSAALARWAAERVPRLATIARLAATAHDLSIDIWHRRDPWPNRK